MEFEDLTPIGALRRAKKEALMYGGWDAAIESDRASTESYARAQKISRRLFSKPSGKCDCPGCSTVTKSKLLYEDPDRRAMRNAISAMKRKPSFQAGP